MTAASEATSNDLRSFLNDYFDAWNSGDEDLLVSDTRAAALLRMRFTREGRDPLEITRVAIYVVRDNKIVEMWGYDPDPERVDAFFM